MFVGAIHESPLQPALKSMPFSIITDPDANHYLGGRVLHCQRATPAARAMLKTSATALGYTRIKPATMSKIRSIHDVFRISQPQIPAARTPIPMNAVRLVRRSADVFSFFFARDWIYFAGQEPFLPEKKAQWRGK